MDRSFPPILLKTGQKALLAVSSVLLTAFTLHSTALADQTVGAGSVVTLGSSDTQDMNCQAFTISSGGKLDISAGGTLQEITTLTIEGELDGGSGSVLKLSSWVNNGTVTTIPATLEFAADCGTITVAGTSDTDGDGISDDLEGGTDITGDSLPDLDVDGDGIYNFLDSDSDGDGKTDATEGTGDDDSDGIPNYLDPLDIDPSSLIINEIDADTPGTDVAEFVELFDGGAGNTPLDGLVIVFYNGLDDASYAAYSLNGQSTDANGYFTLCGDAAQVANCSLDVTPDSNLLQQGSDAVALYQGSVSDFPNDTPLTTSNLLDAIVYDTADQDDPELQVLLNAGQPQISEDTGGNKTTKSIQLCPTGTKNQRDTDGYSVGDPTPGADNYCYIPEPLVCDGTLYQSAAPTFTDPAILTGITVNSLGASATPMGDDSHGVPYNAMGYNTQDNLLYGIATDDKQLVMIDADGIVTRLGAVSGITIAGTSAGDMDDSGTLYMKGGSDDQLHVINVAARTGTSVTLSRAFKTSDWAWNPTDGLLYAIESNDGLLYTIDPVSGLVTLVSATSGAGFGATFFDSANNLYGIHNSTGDLYRIDIYTGERFVVATGLSPASGNDGASCRGDFAIDLQLTATADKVNPAAGEVVTFSINLQNAGPSDASNIAIKVNLPDGLVYASDDDNLNYNAANGIWTVSNLLKNTSASLTLTATTQATGSYIFSAEVISVDQVDINSNPALSFSDDDLADGAADNDEVRFSVMDSDDDGIPDDTDIDNDNDGILDADEGTGDADNDGISNNLDRDSDNDGIPDLNEQVCGWSEGRWVLGEPDVNDKVRIATYQHPQGAVIAELGDGMIAGTLRSNNVTPPHEYPALFGAADPTIEGRSILGIGSGASPGANNGTAITLDLSGFTVTPELILGIENLGGGTVTNPYRYRLEILDAADVAIDLNTINFIGTEYAPQGGSSPVNGPFDELFAIDNATGDISITATGTDSNNARAAFWNALPATAAKIRLSIMDATTGYGDSIRIYLGTDGSGGTCSDDPDADSLPNYQDVDSDGDGITDNTEAQTTAGFIAAGTDSDGDSLIDTYAEKDVDDNWVSYGLDPLSVDTDLDGIADFIDPDSDGDGILDLHEGEGNTDSDTAPNYRDLDADGDGIPDSIEGQTTGGFTSATGNDTDNNGIDDAFGAGLKPVDTDVDGIPDFLDTDADASGANDTIEAGLMLDNADADSDGLDDAIDSDDQVFGPADTGITDPLAHYPLNSGTVAWRKANAPPAFMTAETWHIESGNDFGRMLFTLNPLTGQKTEIGSVPYSTTGMAYDSASGTLYILSNNGEIAAWNTASAYAWTVIGSTEDPGWTDPLPANVSYQTGSFYNGALYFVPTYTPGSDPANSASDLFRIDFTDPMTPSDVVKVADMGGALSWNNNDDMAIDPETGIVYGRSDTNDRDNNQRTSYLYSYDIANATFSLINDVTVPYDYNNPPAPGVKNDFSGLSIAMEFFDGELWGAAGNGTIYRANKETGDISIITAFVSDDADGSVGGDWAGSVVNKFNPGNSDFNENDTAVVIDIMSTDDSDIENSGLTYSLGGTTDAGLFDIDPDNGEITFKTTPDFEAPADSDGDNIYRFTVKVCDSLNACSSEELSVTVLDVDEDRDNDGLLDSVEAVLGTDPEDADSDGDGLSDGMEAGGVDNDPATTADNINTDPLDSDSDDDGLSDGEEVAGVNGNPATGTNPNEADTDGDGVQDGTELGITGPLSDGNSEGSSPVAYAGTNPAIQVVDADPATTTDPLKADTDDGGICDGPNTVTGVCDAGEDINTNGRVDEGETNPNNQADEIDTDSDGLTDAEEADLGTDPALADTDDDGLNDGEEAGGADGDASTTADNTNPLNPDTDGDGIYDGPEVGGNVNNPTDTDTDGIPDVLDTDDDGDGILTQFETPDLNGDGDPADAQDTDSDNTPDYLDTDDDNDGKLTRDEGPDANADGDPADAADMDGDGLPNYLDDSEVPTLHVQVRGILQGAYDYSTGLMSDDLRVKELIPLLNPYTDVNDSFGHPGTETADPGLLAVTGNDAIVDWVLVELRSATEIQSRISSRAGLLQRDGDIIDPVSGD
ncbi:MAG: DUF6923 family protein, partial [Thiolinea sp.]